MRKITRIVFWVLLFGWVGYKLWDISGMTIGIILAIIFSYIIDERFYTNKLK